MPLIALVASLRTVLAQITPVSAANRYLPASFFSTRRHGDLEARVRTPTEHRPRKKPPPAYPHDPDRTGKASHDTAVLVARAS